MNVYLDNAATTPLLPEVKDYIISLLDDFQNPSSQYSDGKKTREIIESSRESVARFINAEPEEIIFTSGGSASNSLAINGYEKEHCCSIFYSAIAHKSILECVKDKTWHQKLYVDEYGKINLFIMEDMLKDCSFNPFVVIDYANSEIGIIQDVKNIIDLTHEYNGVVYLDCTGSISSIPIDVKELDVDMIGFSGHKIHALKGCGVLYKKKNIKLRSLIYGSQENGLFAGTENVLGIASIGKAVELFDYSKTNSKNRDYILNYISSNIPKSYVVNYKMGGLPNNLFISFSGVDGEQLMTLLDEKGVQVSTGSACNSGNKSASNTLKEIRFPNHLIHSCIRMTFSGDETKEEIDYVCKTLKDCVEILRKFS